MGAIRSWIRSRGNDVFLSGSVPLWFNCPLFPRSNFDLRTCFEFRVSSFEFSFHVLRGGPNREEKEKGAEHVLAFRNPRHRFDMQRMNCEERGNKSARPDS